jgi:phosphatidylserine decarboxylase
MIEKSGLRIILLETIILIFFLLIFTPLSLLILLLLAFTIFFFRDPPREIQDGIVSPADGRIDFIENQRIEIFMSPFDCHINRSPVAGKVERIVYKKGKFIPAYRREDFAERNEIYIRNNEGVFKVTQIAGFFARRIKCYVKEGDWIEKGEKIGMIKFGSRVCVDLPEKYRITRKIGEKVRAGETIALEKE